MTKSPSLALPLPRLATGQQWLIGFGVAAFLLVSLFLTHSLLVILILCGFVMGVVVVRNPSYSLYAFIIINVILSMRLLRGGSIDSPGALESIAGLCFVAIILYWVIYIRLILFEPLSQSSAQLPVMLFFVWSIPTTILHLFFPHSSPIMAIREILNLLPLLILPVLYERFIEPGSGEEKKIFALVLLAGCISIVWSVIQIRSNIAHAQFLYETGRSRGDETLAGFVVLIATTFLMSTRKFWNVVMLIALWGAAWVGVIVSLSRGLYVATFTAMVLTIILGTRTEKKTGGIRIAWGMLVAGGLLIPICMSFRLIRLLAYNYLVRFLTTQHLGTDLSLLQRYVEWGYVWDLIKHSPFIGYGFGSEFRAYNIILKHHSWVGFSHSSYLYMIFKTGFPGALLFFVGYGTFLTKGYKLLKSPLLTDFSRALVRAGISYLIVILIYAYTGPIFDSKTDIIWVGLIWGYFLALEKSHRNSTAIPSI
jgi:O-antigen ligase